jgi:uncharacterized membrane protein YfcA
MLAEFSDGFVLLFGTFLGAIVSSFAGFAFSPVAGIVMVDALPPQQLVALLMICSIPVQLATLVHSRRTLVLRNVGALLAGGAIGVPLAVFLLRRIDADAFQLAFGLFLASYALLMLLRRARVCVPRGGKLCEVTVGFLGGVVGGLTAMPGAIPVLYCDLRGQGKEAQRALVQPFILAMQIFALTVMALSGDIDRATIGLAATALPALAAGTFIGLLLFGRLPDAGFRRAVLVVLLFTGASTALEHVDAAAASSGGPIITAAFDRAEP